MIKLRRTLERGRSHPILGPILLILLVLLLAMMFLHAAHDSHNLGADVGGFCLGIAMFLGLLVLERLHSNAPMPLIVVRGDRGPPAATKFRVAQPPSSTTLSLSLPLRR